MQDAWTFREIGEFLADPTKERIERHHMRILEMRNVGYIQKNFTNRLLESRWGKKALLENDIRI